MARFIHTGRYIVDQVDKPLTAAGMRVLEAAGELFYREGIHAVGVALVAERAGVTKKTLYDCFGSKDALVARYLRARHDRWWEHLEARLAAAPAPRASALFDAYLDHPALATDRGCAFLNAAAELPPGHPGLAVVREHKAAVRHRLGELVAEALPEPARVEETADLLWLVLEGAVAHLGLDGEAAVARARAIARAHLGG